MIFPGSMQLCAGRDVVIDHQKMKLFLAVFLVHRGQEHAAGVDPHHRSRREIGGNCFASLYLHCPEIGLAEGVKIDLIREEGVD